MVVLLFSVLWFVIMGMWIYGAWNVANSFFAFFSFFFWVVGLNMVY